MKLQFLGTAAAEGIPAIFCTCETCRIARQKGGKNIRSRCQSLVDDRLLIDFGPDTYYHSMRDGIDLTYVFNVLITLNDRFDGITVLSVDGQCIFLAFADLDALGGGSGDVSVSVIGITDELKGNVITDVTALIESNVESHAVKIV